MWRRPGYFWCLVFSSMMPKGVEHEESVPDLARNLGDFIYDAERR